MKDSKQILEHIAKDGTCDDLDITACSSCPFSRLKRRDDDKGWLSCIEAVAVSPGSFEKINEGYKIIAREMLFDLAIEKELEGDEEK